MILWVITSLSLLSPSWENNSQLYNINAQSNNPWAVRIYGGYAARRPLMAILTYGDFRREYHHTGIRGIDLSRVFHQNWKEYPIDWSIRLGYIRHNENGFQPNHNQYNLFFTAHYNTNYKGVPIRWFIGEGLSWSELVPYVEGRETTRLSDRQSQLMNYINVGFDMNVGDIIGRPELNQLTVGIADSHRSGIYKSLELFNRTQGGGNFLTVFFEYNF